MLFSRPLFIYLSLFVLTVLVTLGLLFYFFGKKQEGPINLKVVGFWSKGTFSAISKSFEKENPLIKVSYEEKDPINYLPSLKASFNSNSSPDLFWFHSSWGTLLKNNLDSLPSSIMSSNDYEKTFYPLTKTDLKSGGFYKGFPLEMNGLALLYNKVLLASSHLDGPPATWTDLLQTYVPSLTTTSKGRILTSAIALGSVNNVENFSEILGLFLLQNQVEFVKNGQLVLFNNRSTSGGNLAAEAIDFYFRFSKIDKTWDFTQPNSVEAFARGKTAMVILPLDKIHNLLAVLKKENLTLDFGVAPVPQLPGGRTVSWGSYWSLGVSSTSRAKLAAWKLADYLVSEKVLRKIYQLESQEKGDFGRVYPRVAMAKEQTTNPILAPYVTQAVSAKSWFLNSDTFDQSLNDQVVGLFKNETAKVETGNDGLSALKKIMNPLNNILTKYGVINKPLPEELK